ncbi:MAG: transposase, partial [Alphaproteobacteria bacterium]|nr:transposase [Alphaproteobacteria bacterium]
RKVEKHFDITITDTSLTWRRRQDRIDQEARFDGVYVIRTSLKNIAPDAAVEAYKSLATVERAFRIAKTDLKIRPVWVYTEDHVRGHVFLCMLAYYVEWHMRQRATPVEKARPSPSARRKAQIRETPDGLPVHSFRTLIDDLASVVVNVIRLPGASKERTTIVTRRTKLQSRAFELLEVNPDRTVPINMTG